MDCDNDTQFFHSEMKYILLKSILINNDIVGVMQSPERNCKNLINKEIFHTKSELKLNRRLWQFRRKTLGKLIQGILVIWIWQGNDRRCESPRAKSFHCEPILKTLTLFYWDSFFEIHSSFIKLLCAIAQKEAIEGSQRDEKYERRLVYILPPTF